MYPWRRLDPRIVAHSRCGLTEINCSNGFSPRYITTQSIAIYKWIRLILYHFTGWWWLEPWCYPKYHQMHRLPHELENFSRPRMVLTAVLAHGWRTSVYVSDDETVNHGANMVCEVLSRTLQSIFEEKGIVPQHLCLQCDNTVAFSKNSDTHLWVAYAVARGLITSGSVNYKCW